MVFRADSDGNLIPTADYKQVRYLTWNGAVEGHAKFVSKSGKEKSANDTTSTKRLGL